MANIEAKNESSIEIDTRGNNTDPEDVIRWTEYYRGNFPTCNEFSQTLHSTKIVLGGFSDQELTEALLKLQIYIQDKDDFTSEQCLLTSIRVTDAVARIAWERKLIDECPVQSNDFPFFQPTLKTE